MVCAKFCVATTFFNVMRIVSLDSETVRCLLNFVVFYVFFNVLENWRGAVESAEVPGCRRQES